MEELGLDVGRLTFASIDWAPSDSEGDKLLFLFATLDLTPTNLNAASFTDGEIAEIRYVPLDEIDDFTIPRLARRLRATVDALSTQTAPTYLEHGSPA